LRGPNGEAVAEAGGERTDATREYLNVGQLAGLTPWSPQAISAMVKRGVLKPGLHYFQPFGRGGQLIFKWTAIVSLIEGTSKEAETSRVGGDGRSRSIPMADGNLIDVEEAKKRAQRLLG
jgi:hypothetical protein